MASTFSILGFELQATGENANTWGDKTNVNLELIDDRLASIGTFSNTSSFSLSAPSNATKSQANGAATLKFTGSAGSAFTVTMPAKLLMYNVVNLSGQDITFQCSTTTTTATIKSGQNGVIHSDGSANVYLISTVANDFDDDVTITSGDGALLTLRSSEATVVDGDVLGALQIQASGETGTDALAVAASIVAEADNTFAADNNETDLVFKLGQSEAATEKRRLTHEGDLNLVTDNKSINFGADSEITLTHVADTGLTLTHTATGAGTPVVLNLKSEEDAIADGDVIGKITFTAGDDSGTDAIATAASIEAEADDTFAADSNKTDLVFKLGSSEAATEKMRLAHEGVLSIPADGSTTTNGIHIGAGADLKLFHESDTNIIQSGSGNFPIVIRADNNEQMAYFAVDGEAILYHNGVQKLATSSAGVSVTGALTASGDVTAFSDERLKSDVKTIDNALDKVMSMRGVSYTKQAEKGIGVIAQEVEKIIPEVVTDGEYKSVAYGNMVGVLIEAIKELKSQLDNHKQGCKCHGTTD